MDGRENDYSDQQKSHDGGEHSNDNRSDNRQEIFSKVVRAGKRTYFFDVKATRGNDYYLTITESKKRFNRDGRFFYEKHKLFLYKEDFDKFGDGLAETIAKIQELREADGDTSHNDNHHTYNQEESTQMAAEQPQEKFGNNSDSQFTEVSFDDLGTSDND